MYIYTIMYIWYKHITCIMRQKSYIYIYIHIHSWLHIQWHIYIFMITYVHMITHTHIFESIYAFTYNTHTHTRVCARTCVCVLGAARLCGSSGLVVDPTYSTLQEDRDIHQNQDLTNPKWGVIMIHSTQSQSPRFGSLKQFFQHHSCCKLSLGCVINSWLSS